MAILVGVQPGGKGKFAVCAVYWSGTLPGIVVSARAHSGVDEVLAHILGISGEWDVLNMVAIASPLTWSGSHSGWRKCDKQLRKSMPSWAPDVWFRAPNNLPGSISVQGPALTWAMAKEAKLGQLPAHGVVETHPRACLAHIASDMRHAVLGYRKRDATPATQKKHIDALTARLTEPGILRFDVGQPQTSDELDALVCAMVALGVGVPECGLVMQELAGGDIRPVGKRSLMILSAFP
jgi:predicted nuclease with RNAse H fold